MLYSCTHMVTVVVKRVTMDQAPLPRTSFRRVCRSQICDMTREDNDNVKRRLLDVPRQTISVNPV